MQKDGLKLAATWEPITKRNAVRLGLAAVPLAPVYRAKDIGLVLDKSVWFEARIAPSWRMALRLHNQRGQPVIAEVRMFPDEPGPRRPGRWSGEYGTPNRVPPGGITARVLRMVRTQAFRKDLLAIVARFQKPLREAQTIGAAEAIAPLLPAPRGQKRGRKGRTDQELARIAETYQRAHVTNRPPLPAVAKAHRLSLSQARDVVRRARLRGLFTPASKQGKGGGVLTKFAQRLLRQNVKKHKGGMHNGKKR